jgi:hypothetical protein
MTKYEFTQSATNDYNSDARSNDTDPDQPASPCRCRARSLVNKLRFLVADIAPPT